MKENLTGLIDLQKVDKELQELEALKGDLPQIVKSMKAELAARKSELENKSQSLAELRTKKALLEGELKVSQEKLNQYKEKLYSVTSNREYDAITLEIEGIEEKISNTEDAILELLTDEENLEQGVSDLEPAIEELEKGIAEKEEELAQKIRATEAEYARNEKLREELSGKIIRSVLYQYERIRKGLGNSAVAELKRGACTGCQSHVPPQRQLEIRMMNELILCEHCGRIMVASSNGDQKIAS